MCNKARYCWPTAITIDILAVATEEEVCSPIWEKKSKQLIDEQAENYFNPSITTKYQSVNTL